MSLRFRALLAVALLGLASAAGAQGWYSVELVIFAHLAGDGPDAETWRDDPGFPDTALARPIGGAGLGSVGPGAYRLSGVWQALRASGRYRPIRHLAWTQAGRSAANAPVVLVGDSPADPVRGTAQVSRGRFLHLKLDLLYQDADRAYRFRTRRRMRSNELHYLDHPLIGVVAIVTPLEG